MVLLCCAAIATRRVVVESRVVGPGEATGDRQTVTVDFLHVSHIWSRFSFDVTEITASLRQSERTTNNNMAGHQSSQSHFWQGPGDSGLLSMLRADAPAFVPSFDTCERITTSHQPLPSSKAQTKAKSRPRSRRHKTTDDTTSTTTRDSQDAITEESKRRKNRKTKSRSQRRGRRTSEHDSERVSHVADEEEPHPLTGDSSFPPLVSEIKNPIARTTPHHDRDWSLVEERAHELEKEQRRKEAANVLLATGSVRLVPLVCSTTCNVSSVSTPMDHESDETHQVPTRKLQHNVTIDINKLRNRWWDLIREKRAKDFLEQQRQLEDTHHHQSQVSHGKKIWSRLPPQTGTQTMYWWIRSSLKLAASNRRLHFIVL